MSDLSRRGFLRAGAAVAAAGALPQQAAAEPRSSGKQPPGSGGPVVIASANGLRATEKAMTMIRGGADTLDAVIAGVNILERDPNDHSVGYGGVPNEDGVVELDSCVMHGPTHDAGAVAALRNIKTPSIVARLVMKRTDHVLLVGEGALRFARAHGLEEVELLTDDARKIWLEWKERHSDRDDWLGSLEPGEADKQASAESEFLYTYGTINCCALDAAGDLSGVTTTSGLGFKIPGRVGDSPIIGAGLYVDNEVGAAGSTGRGEAVIRTGGARTVIEAMRHGMSPTEACVHAVRYLVRKTRNIPRLLNDDGKPRFEVKFYALAKDGRFGAASIWPGGKFAVFASGSNRIEKAAHLFDRP